MERRFTKITRINIGLATMGYELMEQLRKKYRTSFILMKFKIKRRLQALKTIKMVDFQALLHIYLEQINLLNILREYLKYFSYYFYVNFEADSHVVSLTVLLFFKISLFVSCLAWYAQMPGKVNGSFETRVKNEYCLQ